MILDAVTASRVLIEADLAPMQGQRFQPTGFADLGAAVYTLADETQMLLVESAQSMGNRLERTILTPEGTLVPELEGLSYVTAKLHGEGIADTEISSLTEPHRMASPFFIQNEAFKEMLVKDTGYSKGGRLDWRRINAALFKYDVNCLLHGVFLSLLEGGRIKAPRLISAFIEASNVHEAVSGGVKNSFDPSGEIQVKDESKDAGIYSNVPYQRIEFTAEKITAYFNVDAAGIRGLGLCAEAQELLFSLALLKARRLLDGGLRLRTACDLKRTGELRVDGMSDLPDGQALLEATQSAISACREKGLFAAPPVTALSTECVRKKSNKECGNAGEDSS